ncbi:MAG: hemagglutinin repeat-containing protein [Sebaldella sp.]|nr:hemagglutinin repeat-containing protein [Sebaldella sp.]
MKKGRVFQKSKKMVSVWLLVNLIANISYAEIILKPNTNQNTTVDKAQNGANIININTPNNKGISVNEFNEFRTKDPTVFNNFGEGVGRSYLAGLMAANPNLSREQAARLILNRVGGNNRTEIENYLEVMSNGKTDMVFSSPNGIYLNNTGFINFDKVMFTTANVNLDQNGELVPFNIRGGDIIIGRQGINAEGLRYIAFLSQKINIDGQINGTGSEVDLIAGNFDYNPNTKDYTKQGTNNNEILVSSSAYGSMYGNQIKIVAVGGNVGVAGDTISERVLKINADGTIVTNRTQAKESIEIIGKEYTQNTSMYSEGNIKIEADKVILKGTGTQGNNIDITGKLDNQSNLYAKGNVIVGSDAKNTGQLISEGILKIQGNLNTENLVYGKENINIFGYLYNTSDMQSEGNIKVGSNLTNKGRILTDNILNIGGITVNEGTLYGKNRINLQGLTNTGNIKTTGDITALNTLNAGKIIAEGNVSILDLENQNELVINKLLTTNNLTNTGALSTGEGIISNGNAINHGELKTNGSFVINGNLNNYNILNVGNILSTRDLLNYGNLKAVEKLLTRGTTFYNQGEILASNLDVDNTNIQNINKITVIENAKLKGNNINNQGHLSGTNIDLITSALTNSSQIIADGIITANNTNLNNTGYIGSNQKIVLNGSNISNQGSLESNVIEMYNLFSYNNNGGNIKGTGVYLSTTGNIDLRGSLHGESDLRVSGYDIWNNGTTTGTGYIEVKGHDITNNTELASSSIVIEGTGNIINNNIITGTNGNISGYNIVNNDLISFSEGLGIRVTDKITNNVGKAIYAGRILDMNFNTLENLGGELLSQGSMSLTGSSLLNKVVRNANGILVEARIEATGDIGLNINTIENIGEVEGLNDYEVYYETWDGLILTEAEVQSIWKNEKAGENKSNKMEGLYRNGLLAALNNPEYQFLLANIFLNDLWELDPTAVDYEHFRQGAVEGYFDNYPMSEGSYIRTSSAQFSGVALKGKLKSNAITTYATISAGNNITINANNMLNNKDAKITAGNNVNITAGTIKNQTSIGNSVQLKDGIEYYKQEHYGSGSDRKYHVKYWRGIENGDIAYASGQASVIEGLNVVLNTGNLNLTPEIERGSQIVEGVSTGGGIADFKPTNTGQSNGSGLIVIEKNISPIIDTLVSGVLGVDPLGAKSSLFTTTTDQTSKYLIETRSKYVNLGEFYGSDYFLSRLGYNESDEWNRARRLGDAYYEYLIVTRAISDKLGTRFINGLSDKELMKSMLDNSVEVQKDLQLTVGVALTPSQVKALKSDVIWYEYEMVEGQKVLVPKVYLSQTTLATIEADGRDRIGGLNLTAITADELRNNGQLIGNGGATYINAGKVYNVTDTNQLAEIRGNQISITATAGNIENIGGVIRGIESVSLLAENGNIINSSSKVTSKQYTNGRNNTEHENLLSIGEISSKGTTYIEGKNYLSEAGLLGGSDVILNVKEDVKIGALTLSGSDNSGSSSDNYAVYKSNQNIGGVLSADNLYVSGKNLNIEGSTVAVNENAILNVEKINIESKVDNTYSESKSKDKGFMSSRESHTKSYEEQNVEAQLFVGGSTLTKGDINIIGSTFVTGEDSYLGGNVTSTSRELNSSYYHQEKKTGFVSNFDVSSGGMSAGAGIQKTEDTININQKTQAMSNVVLGHGTVVDGEKLDLTATNFQHGAIVVNSKEVNYGATKNTYDEKTEHKESYIGVSASISSPLLNRIDQAYNGGKSATQGNGTAGLVNGGVAVINSAVGTINGLAGNQRGANNDFYVSANVGLTASQSESKSHTYYETAVVTTISGLDKDSSITYNNTDKITYEGTQSYNDKFIYNNVKEIDKKAVELNNSYSSSSNSTSMSGGMAFDTVTARPGGMNASISGSNSNYDQGGTSYQNGLFVGVNEDYNNVGKMTIDGFEQYGGKVTGNIAELDIKSKQNTSKTDGSSTNYSAGTNMQVIGTANGAKKIDNDGVSSWTVGGNKTTGDRNYVDTPSAFVVGEGSDLSIGKVTNTGAVIGTEEKSNGKIKIDEYIGKNINNKDTYNTTGGTISTGGVGVEYQNKEKEGITHNTVIGSVEIGKSSGDEINRDINKVQETTKDKDSGHYNTFVESGVIVLATEEGRKNFVENIGLAGEEIVAVGRVIDTTINKQEEDKRNPLTVLGEERQAEKWRNEGLVEEFKKAETQDEMSDAIEKIGAKEGYEVEVIYSDSSNRESLDGKKGEAYIDDKGKIVIVVNTEAEGIGNKDVLAGVLAEELSHGINYANGKDKGKGTETLAGHSNNYFAGKLGDSNTSLSLTGDGKDYNNVDFGEHVGNKIVLTPSKNDKRNSELVIIDNMITMLEIKYSEIKNDKNLSETEKKAEITKINNYLKGLEILMYPEDDVNKIMTQLPPEAKKILSELKEVVKFNDSKGSKDYFSNIYESMTADTLIRQKDPKTGEEKIIIKKKADLNNINDEILKFTTQAIRDQIKSDIPIYLQIPSESQKDILEGSSEIHASTMYTKTSDYRGITVYFDNDISAHNKDIYISGVESINGTSVKFDRNNYGTIIDGKQTMKDSEIHEIIGHPTDYVRLIDERAYLYDEKGKITGLDYSKLEFAGNPKIIVNPIDKNHVLVEKFAQEVKGKNGETLYYIPSIPVYELNPILLENMMRNKYNTSGKENERIQYLNIDTSKSIIIKKDEFNRLFGK